MPAPVEATSTLLSHRSGEPELAIGWFALSRSGRIQPILCRLIERSGVRLGN